MGRPLSQKLLKKMNVSVFTNDGTEKKLVQQIGYNKYKTEDDAIVTLDDDVSLKIEFNGKKYNVVKILRHTFYTSDGNVFAYKIKETGGIELVDSDAQFVSNESEVESAPATNDIADTVSSSTDKEPVVDKESNEPTVETAPVTNDVTDTVSSSNDKEPVVDEEA